MTTCYDDVTDEEWLAYLWWRDWLRLWEQVGLGEQQWATLYLPYMRGLVRAPGDGYCPCGELLEKPHHHDI